MATLTISNKIIKNDAVILSRKEYQSLVRLSKIGMAVKRLPKGIREGLEDIRMGRVKGPFYSVEELRKDLES